jgi:hypothetical protein
MNGGLLALNVVTGGNLKKQAALVLATMAIIVACHLRPSFPWAKALYRFCRAYQALQQLSHKGSILVGQLRVIPMLGATVHTGHLL